MCGGRPAPVRAEDRPGRQVPGEVGAGASGLPLSRALPVLVEPGLTPPESLARDRFLLDAVVADPARWPAALRVYDVAGEVLSLGRWQLAPVPAAGAGVAVMRRHAGGRATAFGSGFVGVTLVLPRRGALLEPAPALRPEQVVNRYVRGILRGLERHGVPALYPGRDTITAGRRLLGVVAFTEARDTGAVLVETILAASGDLSTLPRLLDRTDPGGVVRAAMLLPADTTSVATEHGGAPPLHDLAAWMADGCAERLGVAPVGRTLGGEEAARVAELAAEFDEARWLLARRPRTDLGRRGSAATMLGVLDVRLAVGADGTIQEACIAGDLIAGDDTIPALEERLRGCAPERPAVAAVAEQVLADPRRFLLGIGPVDTLVDTVMQALA